MSVLLKQVLTKYSAVTLNTLAKDQAALTHPYNKLVVSIH